MKQQRTQLIVALSVLLVAWLSGCAESELATPDCSDDSDCAAYESCDRAIGVCIETRSDNSEGGGGGVNGGSNSDENNGSSANGGSNNQTTNQAANQSTNQGNDSEPVTNQDANADQNDDDPIVPPSNDDTPTVNSDDGGGDDDDDTSLEPCAEQFAACDPGSAGHGDFLCVEINDEGDGACFLPCEQVGEPDSCDSASYCRGFTDVDEPICAPTECETHSDCTDGSCIQLENDYGLCVDAGGLLPGESCTAGEGAEGCQEGYYCDAPEGGSGQCQQICDPWNSNSCGGGVCRNYWRRSGLCTTAVADYDDFWGGPAYTFDPCTPGGSWCDDGVRCMELTSSNICMAYCRPGHNDCPLFSGEPSQCNPYMILPGADTLGLCMPACSLDSDCATGSECVDQLCRETCQSGADCCPADDLDCGAICESSGYCR